VLGWSGYKFYGTDSPFPYASWDSNPPGGIITNKDADIHCLIHFLGAETLEALTDCVIGLAQLLQLKQGISF